MVIGWWQGRQLRLSVRATEETARLAKDDFEMTHRAMVSIENVRFFVDGVEYILRNSGKLPATQVGLAIYRGANTGDIIVNKEAFYRSPEPEGHGLVIAPDEATTHKQFFHPPTFPNVDWEEVKKGNLVLGIAISVTYIDGFCKERTTWKWYKWDQQSSFREFASRQD